MENIMNVGFTGTQFGMMEDQLYTLYNLLEQLEFNEFHHGNCIGADEQAVLVVKQLDANIQVHSHPPTFSGKESHLNMNDVSYERKPYLYRNKDIVNFSDMMFATPKEFTEQLRSGTWATIRYAKKSGAPLTVIYPDGSVENFNQGT